MGSRERGALIAGVVTIGFAVILGTLALIMGKWWFWVYLGITTGAAAVDFWSYWRMRRSRLDRGSRV